MKRLIIAVILTLPVFLAKADQTVEHFHLSEKPCDLEADIPKTLADIKAFLAKPEQTEHEAEKLHWDMIYLRACIDKAVNWTGYDLKVERHLEGLRSAV
jgi:hypothetical protein